MRCPTAILLLPLLVLLAACSTFKPTPYQPVSADNRYGFQDTRLDDETWRVSVSGNSRTSRDLVENQLLYRASEIALAQGADGFVVLDREIERDINYQSSGVAMFNPFFAYPYGGFWWGSPYYAGFGPQPFFGSYSGTVREISRYTAYAEVRLYSGTAPVGQGPAFDARQVQTNLASKINRPTTQERG